jgi:hypothetical protein
MPFSGFLLQFGQCLAHHLGGLGHHFRVRFGPGRARRTLCSGCSLGRHAARHAQFVGPYWNRRQCGLGVFGGRHGQCHGRLEGIPDHKQLGARGIEQRREACFHAGPAGIARKRLGLLLPMLHIGPQHLLRRLGIAPGLGGQHFNALGQQDGRLALDLHPVLQVLNHLDSVGQLHLEQ